MTQSKITIFYYALLLTVLVSQALYTVYQGSVVIGHGQQLTQLERQRTELVEKSRSLKQSLAADSSLLHISQSPLYTKFVPVNEPLVITSLNTVASR
jgi:hypothetical protein